MLLETCHACRGIRIVKFQNVGLFLERYIIKKNTSKSSFLLDLGVKK